MVEHIQNSWFEVLEHGRRPRIQKLRLQVNEVAKHGRINPYSFDAELHIDVFLPRTYCEAVHSSGLNCQSGVVVLDNVRLIDKVVGCVRVCGGSRTVALSGPSHAGSILRVTLSARSHDACSDRNLRGIRSSFVRPLVVYRTSRFGKYVCGKGLMLFLHKAPWGCND